jgi:putative transposase
VVLIDGIVFHEHCILIALGIAADGTKHVLGLREGSTENATVANALLGDLISRGLPSDRALLFVIDGGKGIHRAIRDTFGDLALVHRCHVHKKRNVRRHLPERLQGSIVRVMNDAYARTSAPLAKRQLERLARSLDRTHPGAAASLREGLDETLTLQRLGIRGSLYRTLATTNPVENLNGSVSRFTRNVKRWRDGAMVVRWVATGVRGAEHRFRRVRGFRDMPRLVAALRKHQARGMEALPASGVSGGTVGRGG